MKRGYTLIELLITVCIVLMLVVVLGGIFFRGCFPSDGLAKQEATQWASEMHIENPSVSCAAYDTDGDGYVSCNVSTKGANGAVQIIPVECASRFTLNSGCRTPKAVIQR